MGDTEYAYSVVFCTHCGMKYNIGDGHKWFSKNIVLSSLLSLDKVMNCCNNPYYEFDNLYYKIDGKYKMLRSNLATEKVLPDEIKAFLFL